MIDARLCYKIRNDLVKARKKINFIDNLTLRLARFFNFELQDMHGDDWHIKRFENKLEALIYDEVICFHFFVGKNADYGQVYFDWYNKGETPRFRIDKFGFIFCFYYAEETAKIIENTLARFENLLDDFEV